jgi:hypothetical protein
MRLLGQLTSGDWSKQIAKSAKFDESVTDLADLAGDQHVNYSLEFYQLYGELSKVMKWEKLDFHAWQVDFRNDPKSVIACLRAIKYSWNQGRYGIICEEDWLDI